VEEEIGTGRLEAFSDGVFAIAITLLIIEVHVPHGEDLGRDLLRLWPSYLGYLTSFLTVGVMWINHHQLFSLIDRADRTFLLLHTFLLMLIAFVPFPTAVLAQYIRTDDAMPAAVLYGATLTLTAVLFNAVWRYAAGDRRLLTPAAPQSEVDDITRAYSFGPFIYGGSAALAFLSPKASAAAYLTIAVFFALPLAHWRMAVRRT
jgi:TMEM175 potassium channel family protein